MSSRPLNPPQIVVLNGSMASTIHSDPTIISNISMVSYDIAWTGTPTGTFTVEVSNTYSKNADGSVKNPGNWTALTLSAPTTATGTSGTGFIDVDQIAAYAIRLTYTPASGTGVLNAVVASKVA